MNDYLPIQNNELSLSEQEISISQLKSPENKKVILFLLPIFFLWMIKRSDFQPFSASSGERKLSPPRLPGFSPTGQNFDPAILDKITHVLESMKKISSLSSVVKTLPQSGSSSGKLNTEAVKEVIDVLGSHMGEDKRGQLKNLANVITMVDKAREVKTKMDEQKKLAAGYSGDYTDQIGSLLEVIKPVLPEEHAKNLDNFKKMAQVMKLMSALDTTAQNTDASENNVNVNPEMQEAH
ncbi:MAG: hypothetical protein AB2421_13305 [Thermotaleaceae bacterium]